MRSWNQPLPERVFSPDEHAAAQVSAVNKMARADKSHRHAAKTAEPLLAGLPSAGEHRFSRKQFAALARYCLWGEPLSKVKAAIEQGRLELGALTFIADKSFGEGPVMTISEYARVRGVPKETVRRHVVGQTSMRSMPKKSRKCFYVEDLDRILAKRAG